MLTGCIGSAGNARLQVALPADCDALGTPLPAPAPVAGDDARLTAARYAAWGKTNADRQRAQTECERRVRARFAKGG